MEEGDRFENYVLKERLAKGGMAEVFRAERVGAMNISREVCIKCILPERCADADFVRMFTDEARISATLRHSNIVSVDHFGITQGSLFACMEWVHGSDASKLLKRVIAQGRAFPVDAALFVVAEVLKALEYAHGKTDNGRWLEIVHRDVTPHNVMVSYSGEVKLTDFGIAKATSRLHQTQGDLIKGKVPYMAPEQATGGALDNRTDLFAVGVTAYELLAGRKPFVGANEVEGVHAMLANRKTPLRVARPEVTPEVDAIVERLLQGDADARFADAGAALDALQRTPALVTGQRTLQRLMRELYPDAQHSTVLPRFQRENAATDEAPRGDLYAATAPAASAFRHTATNTAPTAPLTPTTPLASTRTGTEPVGALGGTQTAAPSAVPSAAPAGTYEQTLRATPPIAAPRPARSGSGPVIAALAIAVVVAGVGTFAVVSSRRATTTAARAVIAQARAVTPTPPPATPPEPPAAPPAVAQAVVDAGAPAGEAYATLTVTAVPWGRISVNGQSADTRGTFRLRPGQYRVAASQNGVTKTRRVSLRSGESERVVLSFVE